MVIIADIKRLFLLFGLLLTFLPLSPTQGGLLSFGCKTLLNPTKLFPQILKGAGQVADDHVYDLGRGFNGKASDKLLMKTVLGEVAKLPHKARVGTYLRGLAEAGEISTKEADDIFFRLQNVPRLADRLKLVYESGVQFRAGYLWEVRTAAGWERLGVKVLDMSTPYRLAQPVAGQSKGDVDLLIKSAGKKYLVECKSYSMETLGKLGGREKILTQIDKYKSTASELGAEQTVIVCLQGQIDDLTLRAVRQKKAIIGFCEKDPKNFEELDKMLRQILVQLP